MSSIKGSILVDIDRCKGCELCVYACPKHVVGMSGDVNRRGYRYATLVADGCVGCTSCGLVCPDGCITVYKVKVP